MLYLYRNDSIIHINEKCHIKIQNFKNQIHSGITKRVSHFIMIFSVFNMDRRYSELCLQSEIGSELQKIENPYTRTSVQWRMRLETVSQSSPVYPCRCLIRCFHLYSKSTKILIHFIWISKLNVLICWTVFMWESASLPCWWSKMLPPGTNKAVHEWLSSTLASLVISKIKNWFSHLVLKACFRTVLPFSSSDFIVLSGSVTLL